MHRHIIPGNRVRLPFTPLPRHQWSHASESNTTLSSLCFYLLRKSSNSLLKASNRLIHFYPSHSCLKSLKLMVMHNGFFIISHVFFKKKKAIEPNGPSVLLVRIGWTGTCLFWLHDGVTGGLEFLIVSAGQHRLALGCREDFEWRFGTDLEEIWGVGHHRAAVQ